MMGSPRSGELLRFSRDAGDLPRNVDGVARRPGPPNIYPKSSFARQHLHTQQKGINVRVRRWWLEGPPPIFGRSHDTPVRVRTPVTESGSSWRQSEDSARRARVITRRTGLNKRLQLVMVPLSSRYPSRSAKVHRPKCCFRDGVIPFSCPAAVAHQEFARLLQVGGLPFPGG